MFVDSHTHLYLDEFGADKTTVVKRAFDAGVGHLMFPNVDLNTIEPMNSLAEKFQGMVDMAIGLHPTEVNNDWDASIKIIKKEALTGKYQAIGEIGMDLYWDRTFLNEQRDAFREQCRMATEMQLPIIIHCREALEEILKVFSTLDTIPNGVFHSFSGTIDDVKLIRSYGDFYFGINGIVTFKNSKLREVLPEIGLDRLLIETDSPYLAPAPMRGKRNESSYMIHTAAYIANFLGVEVDLLESATTNNYMRLFKIEKFQ